MGFGRKSIAIHPNQSDLISNGAHFFISTGPPGLARRRRASGRIVNTYQLQDNWNTSVAGTHGKAGVNFTYQRSPNNFSSPQWIAAIHKLDTFGQDIPNRVQIASGDPNLDFREKDTFAYLATT